MTWRGTMAAPSTAARAARARSGSARPLRPCPAMAAKAASWRSGCHRRWRVHLPGLTMLDKDPTLCPSRCGHTVGRWNVRSWFFQCVREKPDAIDAASRLVRCSVGARRARDLSQRRCCDGHDARGDDADGGRQVHGRLLGMPPDVGGLKGPTCDKRASSILHLPMVHLMSGTRRSSASCAKVWRDPLSPPA
jgi:hypothetical protein